jgi:hypothetical protein
VIRHRVINVPTINTQPTKFALVLDTRICDEVSGYSNSHCILFNKETIAMPIVIEDIRYYSKSVYKHNNYLGIRILFNVQGYMFRLIIQAIFWSIGYRLKYIKTCMLMGDSIILQMYRNIELISFHRGLVALITDWDIDA